jgi:hypothetical protein
MGYDTHIMIGSVGSERREEIQDLDNPFDDGSGYPSKKDADGNVLYTGRMEHYFMSYVEMDLCKIYDSSLNLVHSKYQSDPFLGEDHFVYVYMKDGNTQFVEDSYGDNLIPAPFSEVLEAVKKDCKRDNYRRFQWLKGLMESMEDDSENLVCAFYGS